MADATTTTRVTVAGMTCGHCIAAVRDAVGALDGVDDVGVDLESGLVTIRSARAIDRAVLAAAVDEAGYEVAEVGTDDGVGPRDNKDIT